ncbi:hypothetical protein B0H14DRAFT_3442981 [Mycena olivaceomarginata]|nr:hypothetical protein B0H14DRAFT_3442981 [Mycena olivaceomarginata]
MVPNNERVQHEKQLMEASATIPQSAGSELDQLADFVLGMTLNDEGPTPANQPSKLFTSRQSFQADRSSHIPTTFIREAVTMADATASISALLTTPAAAPSPHPPRSTWREQKAQSLATAVRDKIRAATADLAIPVSYQEDDASAVAQLRDKLDAAARVFEDSLNTRICFVSGALPPAPAVTTPLFYDASYLNQSPIAKLDIIAQMLILLGVICHVIIGIATDPCNLIIQTVTMIIKCTMSLHLQRDMNGSEAYDARQQDILEQLPSSLYVALDRFNIDGKTTMYAFTLSVA